MSTSSPQDMPKGLERGYFFDSSAPPVRRAVAFVDGQNLFHSAHAAFGSAWPDYDPDLLARAVCRARGWAPKQTRFYTGIPAASEDPHWWRFWNRKMAVMVRCGICVFARKLHYRNESVTLPDGSNRSVRIGEEKGVDVRIAIDVIRMAHRNDYDVALIFSQACPP